MDNKPEIIKDRGICTTAGRKDWSLMLESSRKAAAEKAKQASRLGHKTGVETKVVKPEVGKGKKDRPREKDGKIEEDAVAGAAGIPGGAAAAAGPGTTTDAIAPFKAKIGDGKVKRRLNEDGTEDETIESGDKNAFSKKAESVAKRKEKLEAQLASMNGEIERLTKLEQLQNQKQEIIAQLDAIKAEMDAVKNEKPVEPTENAEHEASETPAEEESEIESCDTDEASDEKEDDEESEIEDSDEEDKDKTIE